ncbi:MAG TPA: hypothetical protein K8W19_06530 [Victivallis vadensis]|nr:hypothetical protein [Victivallis vadensis]
MRKKYYKCKRRQGVALLFALGILSLLLILGLAFVSNALLSQKVAFNNSSRAQAKMLAQSAISRVAASIMLYQHQAYNQADSSKKFWPTSFTSLFSGTGTDSDDPPRISDQLDYGNANSTDLYSKLNYPGNVIGYRPSDNSNKITWQLVYDKSANKSSQEGHNTKNKKIIGRIAYQVLPPTSSSRLNLQQVLKGAQKRSTLSNIENQERFGEDISELNVEYTTPFIDTAITAPNLGGLLSASSIPAYYDELYTAYASNLFPASLGAQEIEDRKDWIERWFSEGTKAADFEAFLYATDSQNEKQYFAHRFNLGDDGLTNKGDNWYNRFYSTAADAEAQEKNLFDNTVARRFNNSNAIDHLTADAVEFSEQSKRTPGKSGLPFLKSIADDPGTFSSKENRRKQIAANLNDYCDKDLIPTSNVPAEDWATTTTEILYTGNEKTPYIYELGLMAKLSCTIGGTTTSGISIDPTSGKLKFDLALTPAVKLINIYNEIPNALTNLTFRYDLEKIILKGAITKVTFDKYHYTYEDDKGVTQTDIGDPLEVSYPLPPSPQAASFEETWTADTTDTYPNIIKVASTQEIVIDRENDFLGGYAFKAADNNFFTCEYNSTSGPTFKLTDEQVQAKYSHLSNVKLSALQPDLKISATEMKITELAVQSGRMLLLADYKHTYSDASTETKKIGIDYVKSQKQADSELILTATASDITFNDTDSDADNYKFLLGGMRGKDPRQNLNPKDWSITDTILKKYDPATQWAAVMDVDYDASASPQFQGKVNRENDAAPDKAGNNKDKESRPDPAWSSSGHLSTAIVANRPMKSLWELGAIHRGAMWETLNLKLAGKPGSSDGNTVELNDHQSGKSWSDSGTKYEDGDGAILDEVKLANNTRSYGKLDVNMIWDSYKNPNKNDYDGDLVKALFMNLRYGQDLTDFDGGTPALTSGTTLVTKKPNDSDWTDFWKNYIKKFNAEGASDERPFDSRAQFLDWGTANEFLGNAFGLITTYDTLNDAQKEEIIGKTINLLTASNGSLPTVVQVLIVAQTIRDVGGDENNKISITKIGYDGTPVTKTDCLIGQFDIADNPGVPNDSPDQKVYFDEITGETKILVTIDRNPTDGQMMVRKIEYID